MQLRLVKVGFCQSEAIFGHSSKWALVS